MFINKLWKFCLTFLLASSWGFATAESVATDLAPDIVLILVDDLGWQDSGVPFWYPNNGANPRRTPLNERFQTPHQMRMATEGALFSAAYVQPTCAATRISLLSGMNAARHAVTGTWLGINRAKGASCEVAGFCEANWAVNGLQPPKTPTEGLTRGAFNLPAVSYPATAEVGYTLTQPYCNAMTLPMILKRAGYVTLLAGKAHFAPGDGFEATACVTPGQNPRLLGFDVDLGGAQRARVAGVDVAETKGCISALALTRDALKAVDAQAMTKPAFLYLGHFAPNTLKVATPSTEMAAEAPVESDDAAKLRQYADAIAGIDTCLGEVLDWAIDRRARTGREVLVFFMGDDGALEPPEMRSEHAVPTVNAPLRAGKGTCYEGGIRVPLLAWMPGRIPAGSVVHAPVLSEDLFATILDYAGGLTLSPLDCARTPAEVSVDGEARQQVIDGQSLRKALEGQRTLGSSRPILIHYPNIPHATPTTAYHCYSVLRQGEWKLIWHHLTGEKELYNVVSDISEEKNQAKKRPSLVAKLSREMGKLLRERGAVLPRFKGNAIAFPDGDEAHQ